MRVKHVLLIIGILAIVPGLAGVGSAPQWAILFPLGFVSCLGFLLFQLLEKEAAQYDVEHTQRLDIARRAAGQSSGVESADHELDHGHHAPHAA